MANEAHVKQLLELGNACTKVTIDQIMAGAAWGTVNFEAAREPLARMFGILDQFKRLPLGLLPDSIIQQIIATLLPLKASLDQMRDFSIDSGSPVGTRERLVAQYCSQADRFFGAALLYNCLSCILEGRRSQKYNCLSCILEK